MDQGTDDYVRVRTDHAIDGLVERVTKIEKALAIHVQECMTAGKYNRYILVVGLLLSYLWSGLLKSKIGENLLRSIGLL